MPPTHHRCAILLAVVLLAACSPGRGGPVTEPERFSVYLCEPESLVPANTTEICGIQVLGALFSGLVTYDPQTTEPRNLHATSIESSDQRVWTIRLAPGRTFHNGEPVTAGSYVDAWNYAAYGPNAQANAYLFENVEGYADLQCEPGSDGSCPLPPVSTGLRGLRVVDEHTLEVTLAEPFSQFPLTLGAPAFLPLPRAFFADPEGFAEAPIGNGPFRMEGTWEHGRGITVVRSLDYAGEPARADGVEFRVYSEITTAYTDLLAGELDVMGDIPPESVPDARERFGGAVLERESSVVTYLGLPLYDPRFGNPDLRRALSMAIDREAITATLLPDQVPARAMVSPLVAGARPDPCGATCRHDPAAARVLFDAAGGYDGTLELWLNAGAGHEQWLEAVANQLRASLGIADIRFVGLAPADLATTLAGRAAGGPFRTAWVMDYPSPQNYLEPLFSSTGAANDFGYADAEVDRLIAEGNAAATIEAGLDAYHAAEDRILADLPAIPLFFGKVLAVHSERVEGVVVDPLSRINLAEISVVES